MLIKKKIKKPKKQQTILPGQYASLSQTLLENTKGPVEPGNPNTSAE